MKRLAAVLLAALLAASCSAEAPPPARLTVLASPELADLGPVLERLRRDTGVELVLEHRNTLEATAALASGGAGHDLAWLSSDRYLKLRGARPPLSTSTMASPLVIGVKKGVADRVRGGTWAEVADRAAAGELRFGMADPHRAASGLDALVGVATAAAATGSALRPQDVTCDKLGGFLTGRAFSAPTSTAAADEYVRTQDDVDALIGYESVLLSLNDSGKLREPLEIAYPRDGIVLSDYPLMLLKPERRDAYDRVVDWLRGERGQRLLMERGRRPVEPDLPRPPRLSEPIGNALYFPDRQEVLDTLLAAYDRAAAGERGRVVFVLDYSTSMAGARIAGLREAFATLGGGGGFDRFAVGETITVVRFAGRVLQEHTVTVRGQADLDALRDVLAADDLVDGTAIWSALDRGHRLAEGGAVVLMTDGENNAGISAEEFLRALPDPPARTYAIRFGEADPVELDRVAKATGGRVVDAATGSLLEAVKEIRGCR
ncbi:Ca-activated chloride channel family protein [Saccharothrix coeruleofusca]|uniref:substrate-binding and vWA domain-containing protein n=1 Tax=Saccharothrix coeruleofusca TaxID=33919 RepID=UPI001AE1B61E|nr:VWA domain-containing protein [Saccharothrix coeruleofusca]MBP2334664.1 Ca-activated chloride channel family protein [Saccharothrix coeruleofusca]